MNSADQTAVLIAIAFQRSKQNRTRLSHKSFLRVACRTRTTAAFTVDVMNHIAEYGIVMVELDTGGYGLLYSRALCGARSIPASNFLTEEEIDTPNMELLRHELQYDRPDFTDD